MRSGLLSGRPWEGVAALYRKSRALLCVWLGGGASSALPNNQLLDSNKNSKIINFSISATINMWKLAPQWWEFEISWIWRKAGARWHSWLSAWLLALLWEVEKSSNVLKLFHKILSSLDAWSELWMVWIQSCYTLHSFMCLCVNNNRNGQVAISSKSCDLPVAGQLAISMIGIPKKCPRKHFLRMKVKYDF